MPTYEYACRDCGNHLEVVQSFRDAPLTTCGVCGGSLRKVFSAAGIIFKGSGYYVTDSRAKAESGSKASSNGSAKAGASESKSAESTSAEPSKSAESA
jgi:putative FmdB family regulatory protein